jgi:hypothetical protein
MITKARQIFLFYQELSGGLFLLHIDHIFQEHYPIQLSSIQQEKHSRLKSIDVLGISDNKDAEWMI